MSDGAPEKRRRRRIDATGIAEHVRLESCERWLWYRLHPEETDELFRTWGAAPRTLSPLLQARGRAHESAALEELARAKGHEVVDLTGKDVAATREAVARAATVPLLLYQARIEGRLGELEAVGIADALEIVPADGGIAIHVMDMKASREDKVEHRIQVAFYAVLLRQMAREAGVAITALTAGILRPATPESRFDLAPYEDTLALMTEPGHGILERMSRAGRAGATYHLTYRCDGCSMGALCMREAAEAGATSLVPGMSLADKRALERAGISTLHSLATLKEIDPDVERLRPAPGSEELCGRLASQWPVGASLDLHVQRARAVLHRRGEPVASLPRLLDPPGATLPSREVHPDLVAVYLDAQHDFVTDRLWMVSALVVAPAAGGLREASLVELLEEAPAPGEEDAREGELLEIFTTRLLTLVRDMAQAGSATLHFFVYDRHDQRKLLDALHRHLDRLASIPALVDLLTETPALTQSMVSFVAGEARERLNLGLLCQSLPAVAGALGFGFAGVPEALRPAVTSAGAYLPGGSAYETLPRFGSQIPLELAYVAWGKLSAAEASWPATTTEELRALSIERLRALRFVEESLVPRPRSLEKRPLPLQRVLSAPLLAAGTSPGLPRLLVEFLLLEHHARLQELLAHLGHPLTRRVATGSSVMLRACSNAATGLVAFDVAFDDLELDPRMALHAMNVREGDWMTISRHDVLHPRDLMQGRLAIVKQLSGTRMTLELSDMSFRTSRLRYPHRNHEAVERGRLYVLDPMPDDLVGERLLDACRNTEHNHFLRIVEEGPGKGTPRPIAPATASAIADLLAKVEASGAFPPFTARQRAVVAERLSERLLLVQGPPGTGKTHTVAWAVIARLWVAAATGKRMRVLVTAMTHTAVDVLLSTIADIAGTLGRTLAASGQCNPLGDLAIFKESSDGQSTPAPGVVHPLGRGASREALSTARCIVGAVPAGIHRILKDQGGGQVIWSARVWSLVVIDEASQVNLPAALMAGAALAPGGQLLVVGDHRQMPPILAHDWEAEQRRGVQSHRVYASTFEALRDRGFPIVALDRSFRLHASHAAFLERHIYRADRVGLHSERRETLPPLPPGVERPALVEAALRPEHPVVLVEHGELRSLRSNPLESAILAALTRPLVEELGLDGRRGIGIVVPYRAQRALVQQELPELAAQGAIDTVERFQGGERDVVMVSATASDPDFLVAETSFLIDANRFNVAISRPRKKLVVVASLALFHLTPDDLDLFEASLLWKRLRAELDEVIWEGSFEGYPVRVLGRKGG